MFTNTGVPNIAIEKNKSLSSVPRKNGIAAAYEVIKPPSVLGYIPGHDAQTAKLLIRKNETELVNAAATTRQKPAFSRRFVPSHKIPAYHAHVTS